MNLILGSGFAGLSAAYHLGHEHCVILEKKARPFGLAFSDRINGYIWDQGPHCSFTKYDYVKELFKDSVSGDFEEFEVITGNYYQGHWIDHPAQANLYQVPEPLRSQCLTSFRESRETAKAAGEVKNYKQWLDAAFGRCFADHFPAVYTRKYWTVDPEALTTDWIGSRVYFPSVEDVTGGAVGPLGINTHYINKVRYPSAGGYQGFIGKLADKADIRLNHKVVSVDLRDKSVVCEQGARFSYDRLISSLPLPVFVRLCRQATPEILEAAEQLEATKVLILNFEVPHPARRPETLFYVYDADKLATRVHFTEKLATANVPAGRGGIQVEVYYSRAKPLPLSLSEVAAKVIDELYEMGLIDAGVEKKELRYSLNNLTWANVIFTHDTRAALTVIYDWLAGYGLQRHGERDIAPITDWTVQEKRQEVGGVALVGRYGAWKYYWSDDCVMNGRYL